MSFGEEQAAREFLTRTEFSPEEAHRRFPNARRHLWQGIFISHAGRDFHRIMREIVHPVVTRLIRGEGYFVHSRLSGEAEGYRQLVQAALHWCDKFMVVISEHSIANEWVVAEVEWAIKRKRPIVAVRLDAHEWTEIVQRLGLTVEAIPVVPVFDFSRDNRIPQHALKRCLKTMLAEFPQGVSSLITGE
jgi:hypothetical protein